jgi:ornithine--oxo-acid transaminase
MAPSAIPTAAAEVAANSPLKATAPAFTPSADASLSGSRYHAQSTEEAFTDESKYAAHNYHPLPIVFARALGTSVWDPEGKHYLDFLSAYSAVNQGHCHPELVKALCEQAGRLTLSSRAFYNDVFPRFAKVVTETFGYDMVLPMNTGAEAVETAVKIARKWAYKSKGVKENEAIVFSATENFHGRTVSQILIEIDQNSDISVCCHFHVHRSRVA